MPDALMLFAAGLGTRMRPLTETRPKPLVEVAGQTLLDRGLTLARAGGARRIAVNTHYLGEQITAHLAGQDDVALSDEADLLLDTGGGLRKAMPLLGGPGAVVLTLNPDVVWTGPNPVAALRAAWDPTRMDALMMMIHRERATARIGPGDFSMDTTGRLTRQGDWVYGGCQIIRTERLADIGDQIFSLNRLWDLMIGAGRAYGLIHQGGWCDIGRPDCIAPAEALLAAETTDRTPENDGVV